MRDSPWIIVGLLCWPLALLLHLANDKVKVETEPLYQFEVIDRGDVYVVDYGLSLEDCQKLKGGYCREILLSSPRDLKYKRRRQVRGGSPRRGGGPCPTPGEPH